MQQPTDSVQYMRKKYKTFQILTAIFGTITVLAALTAAITGLRITVLYDRLKQIPPPAAGISALHAEFQSGRHDMSQD